MVSAEPGEQKWGEMAFTKVAGHCREIAYTTSNGSLEERLRMREAIYALLNQREIRELKDFIEQLDVQRATADR